MKGLIEIFFEPGKVFDAVREKGIWLAPFLAAIILTIGMTYYSTNTIGGGNMMRQQMEGAKWATNIPEEQKEKMIADADAPAAVYRNSAFAGVFVALFTLLISALALGVAAISGGKMKFSRALGTVSYASWPVTLVRTVLSVIVLMMAADKAALDPQRLLAFNVAAFFDKATTSKPLYTVATSLDLFIIAQVVLTAYGISRVAGIAFTRALIGLVVIWAGFTALFAGLSVLF